MDIMKLKSLSWKSNSLKKRSLLFKQKKKIKIIMKTILITVILSLGFNSLIYCQVLQEWSAFYECQNEMLTDNVNAITVDNDGNIYLTATIHQKGSTSSDYGIIKYNKGGKLSWIKTYEGPGNYHDVPTDITYDRYGNVFVTGMSNGAGTATDICTIKFRPDGTIMWTARYNGNGDGHRDEAYSIAVDNNGNVYVSGQTVHIAGEKSGEDFITIKYDSLGNRVWTQVYDDALSSGNAKAMVIDGDGNVFVTGRNRGPDYGFATIKYSSDGVQQWVSKYEGVVENAINEPVAIGIDEKGNVYVSGFILNKNKKRSCCIIKYDKSGNEQWTVIYGESTDTNFDPVSMAIDRSGNVIVTGSSGSNMKAGDNYITIKYDQSGKLLWSVPFKGLGKGKGKAMAMTIDRDGNSYVTGTAITDIKSLNDAVTVKYDPSGKEIWTESFNSGDAPFMDEGKVIFADDNGNVFVSGTFLSIDFKNRGIFLVKYSQQ
jgi:uncharacterized protein YuzE